MCLCISNTRAPVNCQMPLYLLSSILCDHVHVASSQLSILSVLMLGLCNCVAKMGTFFAEENFTSHGIISHDNYYRFSWNFQTHVDLAFWCCKSELSQKIKYFMSKGKSTALTTYLPLLWQNLFDSAPKWLPCCCKLKTDCIKRPVSFKRWFLL